MSSDQPAVGVSRVVPADQPAVGVSSVTPVEPMGSVSPEAPLAEPMGSVSPEAPLAEPMGSVSPEAPLAEPMGSVSPEAPLAEPMGSVSPEAPLAEPMGSSTFEAAVDPPGGLPPVVRTLALNCSRAHAYATFTARIGEWWPPEFSASGADLADVVIEPHVAGRAYEISKSGDEFTWGAVKAIQDGTAITMVWTLGVRAPDPTELDVRFAGDITGDLADDDLIADVTLRHSGFVSDDDHDRFAADGGWTEVLAAYQACAEA